MAERVLNKTEIDTLLNIQKNQDLKSGTALRAAFTAEQYQQIADAVQERQSPFFIDGRPYELHFYNFNDAELVAVYPVYGHIPMGNYHVNKFMAESVH